MPPPTETWEVYCFPRRQLIFSFDMRVLCTYLIWNVLGSTFKIDSVRLSTIFKRIEGLCFYVICFDVMHQWICFDELYKLMQSFFFQIFFSNFWPKHNFFFFKRIESREYWSNCIVLYVNVFVWISSTNYWKAFFTFQISFQNFGWKPKKYSKE